MRRINQQLPLEECQEILATQKRCVLSVLGDDGYPYGIPLNFVYVPTHGKLGTVYFHSALEGHKVDALAACDKASLCVMEKGTKVENGWWYMVRSVICFGRASSVEDGPAKHDALYALGKKYFPPEMDIEDEIARGASRITMFKLELEHVTGKLVEER